MGMWVANGFTLLGTRASLSLSSSLSLAFPRGSVKPHAVSQRARERELRSKKEQANIKGAEECSGEKYSG